MLNYYFCHGSKSYYAKIIVSLNVYKAASCQMLEIQNVIKTVTFEIIIQLGSQMKGK